MKIGKTERERQDLLESASQASQAGRIASNELRKKKPLSPATKAALEAAVALKAEQKETAQACLREIQAVAKKYNCALHATPVMVPRNDGTFVLAANVNITNLPPEESE